MKHAMGFLGLVEECMPRIKEISTEEVAALQAKNAGFYFIDTREDSEWAAGHAAGAIHIGRGVLERDIERVIADRDAPIVLYCGGGYRSALAADSLQKMGYSNVFSMAGGWREWCEKNYPVER
jgi:rhodanese-related sulfurtransferase